MDRLTALQVFAEVAACGSFTAAADHLDMSRPMVTRYVSELEQWLGSRLLQRTTRRVTLTDAGEQCLRRGEQMIALMQDVEAETATRSGELRGQLRVTASSSFGISHLAPAIVDFLGEHALLKIDLKISETAVNLVEERIDLAIRISAEPDPLLIARPLARCDSVLVASPAYLAKHGTPRLPSELTQQVCLSHANFGKSTWRFARNDDTAQVSVASRYSANDATVLMHASLAGGGIALLPTYLVNEHLAAGSLKTVLADWQAPAMTIYALYPSRRHLSPAVRALLDFLVIRFSALPWQANPPVTQRPN